MKKVNVKDLMSISGKGGLFRFIAQARNGVIVESLQDKKRAIVPPTARISSLEDISIFTQDEDMPLADVLMLIYEKENGELALDSKSDNNALKNYFEEVLPSYDQSRVYVSDIKKVLGWYNTLCDLKELEIIEDTDESTEEETDESIKNNVDQEEPGKSESNEPEK